MKRERMQWMDFFRGVCILLVIMMHSTAAMVAMVSIEAPEWVQTFNLAMEPFRMTSLMFLSGMLLGKSFGKDTRSYISGKLSLIFWPYVIWSFPILYYMGLLNLEYILKIPISAPTLLWYLWFLFAYYMLALVIRRLGLPVLAVAVASLIASLFLPDFLRMSRFAYLFFFFLVGHYYMENRQRLPVPAPLAWVCLALAAVGSYLNVHGVVIRYHAQQAWVPLALIAWIVWAAQYYTRAVPKGLSQPLEWVGRNSLVFYVSHFPVQCAVVLAMVGHGERSSGLLYAAAVGSSLLVAILIQFARERSLFVAGLFDFRKLMAFWHSLRTGRRGETVPATATKRDGS